MHRQRKTTPSSLPKIEKLYTKAGKLFRRLRLSEKRSVTDVAKRAGMSRANLTNIELGNQRMMLHQVKPLCRHIHVDPVWFLSKLLS